MRAERDLRIGVTHGQVWFEVDHLFHKLKERGDYTRIQLLAGDASTAGIEIHPMFDMVAGENVEDWERGHI